MDGAVSGMSSVEYFCGGGRFSENGSTGGWEIIRIRQSKDDAEKSFGNLPGSGEPDHDGHR